MKKSTKTASTPESLETNYTVRQLNQVKENLVKLGIMDRNARYVDTGKLREFLSDVVPRLKALSDLMESAPYQKGDAVLVNGEMMVVTGMDLSVDHDRAIIEQGRYSPSSPMNWHTVFLNGSDGPVDLSLPYLKNHNRTIELLKRAKKGA